MPAIMRAFHQTIDDDPKILTDPIAPRLFNANDDLAWVQPMLDHPFAKQWRASFALRARYAEDALAEGVQRGVRQYVVLGAGLDTFAYRQPAWVGSLQIYEVDHPATQQWKQRRLKDANIPIPPNLRFVPIDFERTSIPEALGAGDFAFGACTLCSWMGVTQYLTRDALDATFRFVLSLAPLSEIVFSFILPQEAVSRVEADALALSAQRAGEVGEPWLTRLYSDELRAMLRSMGFSRIVLLRPEDARSRYFDNRRDGLRERQGEQLMRAIV
jgi:methyltransferase (TIGR00027 family)